MNCTNFMTTPYDKYKNTEEWNLIEKAIQELIENQDLQLTTPIEYVVGYITMNLLESNHNNLKHKDLGF